MANKILNTRIALKIDTIEAWEASSIILKKGEVGIAIIEQKSESGASLHKPAYLMKVGDGTNTWDKLAWLQGVAADVPTRFKSSSLTVQTSEVSGLTEFINKTVQDTNTTYQLAKVSDYQYKLQKKELGDEGWTDVGIKLDIPNDTAAIEALQGLVGDTKVSTQIANAIGALHLDTTYEKVGVAKGLVDALANGAVNTNTQAIAGIKNGEALNDFKAVEGALAGKQAAGDYSTKTEAQGYADTAEQNAKDYADTLVADGSAIDLRVDALEAAVGEGGSVSTQITNAINDLNKADTAKEKEFVTAVKEEKGIITVSRRALAAEDIPSITMDKISDLAGALAKKQDNVVWQSGNYDAASNKAITKSDLDDAVKGLAGATHFIGVKDSLPGTANQGDICIVKSIEYIWDGSKWQELGNEGGYALKGKIVNADIADNAAIAQSKVAGLVDALGSKANTEDLGTMAAEEKTNYVLKDEAPGYADILTTAVAGETYETKVDATQKLADAKSYADGKVNGLNKEDAPVAKKFVSAVSEDKGVITVSRRELVEADVPALSIAKTTGLQNALDAKANDADLHAIAKSGSTDDLVAGNQVWEFNCGSSTVNV